MMDRDREKIWSPELRRLTLEEVRRYALQYGGHRVILKNTLTGTYMHETQEEWEASKDRRPYIAFIEEVGT